MIDYQQLKKTETGEFIVSHHDLNALDPSIGGHPKIFYKGLTEPDEKKYKPSFEKGDLLHLWMEKEGSFVIEQADKPTEQPAKLAEAFHELYVKEEWKNNSMFLELSKHNTTVGIVEHDTYKDLFRTINKRDVIDKEELALFVAAVRFSRVTTEYNKNLREETFLEQFRKTLPYVEFLHNADGKIILTPTMKDTLSNCVDAMKDHPFAAKLAWGTNGKTEVEYFWNKMHDGMVLNRKGKLDKEIVDEKTKTLVIVDYKTTSYPVSSFANPDGAYHRHKLGRQLVSYADGFFQFHKEYYSADWSVFLFNVVVSVIDPYPVMVYATSRYMYKDELTLLERRALWHIQNNVWNMTREEAEDRNNEFINLG